MKMPNFTQLAAFAAIFATLYGLFRVIYNLYFHPLAKFPGPKYASVSNLFYAFEWTGGRWPFTLDELHKKYGPVVRFAPNDLSFATAQSYQDIYGHAKQGKKLFLKSERYSSNPDPATSIGIASERDPVKHREIRRNLAHAFSAKALRTQTDVILKYVNLFVEQVKKYGDSPEGLDTNKIYNWLTFDIIGDLSFGEPFGSVANAETHPWVHTIKRVIADQVYHHVFYRLPWLKLCPLIIRPTEMAHFSAEMVQYTNDLVARRRAKGNDRDDFFARLLSEKATNLSTDFLRAQASTLVVAGSETTATLLAGVSYHLLKNPSTLQHLAQEIRTAFSDADQIDGDTTFKLPYLLAVIEEGLRIFPPAPAGLPRTCPGAEIDGHYVPPGVSVSTPGWTVARSETYFHDAHGFHPERWLPADHCLYDPRFKTDWKEASRPFLIGPRACLGINLAYMEMRIILARMVWEFDWELVSREVDWERDISLKLLWIKPTLNVRFVVKS